nr:carboxypeptidase-like regulatory domain-containing protein [Hyalangium gracile]
MSRPVRDPGDHRARVWRPTTGPVPAAARPSAHRPRPGQELPFQDGTTLTTDDQGAFRTTELEPGTYRLQVDAPGHASKELGLTVPRPEHLSIELEGKRIPFTVGEGQTVDVGDVSRKEPPPPPPPSPP